MAVVFIYLEHHLSYLFIYSVIMWAVYKIFNKRVRLLLARNLTSELGKVTMHNVDYTVDVSSPTTLIWWTLKYPEKPH